MKPFKYKVSHKVAQWGCLFDSLLELKYALSIEKEYSFLRAHIPIYYDPKTLQPTNHIRLCTRRYTPDFLIRHNTTGEAYWIEIKPRAFANSPQLPLRKTIAENYLRWKSYDWQYKVVFDDEILLSDEQYERFCTSRKLVNKTARKIALLKENNLYDQSMPTFYNKVPDTKLIQFVMFGKPITMKTLQFPK